MRRRPARSSRRTFRISGRRTICFPTSSAEHSERAIGEGKYAEARKSLARMRTDEQRASALAGWASAAAGKGDEKLAREMLGEARSLIGSRMQRSDQLEAQMAVASAAVNIDSDMSFEIAEAAIERINRLVAANLEIQTFGGMEEGEIRIMTEAPGEAIPEALSRSSPRWRGRILIAPSICLNAGSRTNSD